MSSNAADGAAAAMFGAFFFVYVIVVIAVAVAVIGGMWKVFVKAGQPGWAAIIPIYNVYVWTQIVGRPAWWVALPFASIIPVVGWIIALGSEIILMNDLSKSYGKDTGFTIGLVLLPVVFVPMLGFGSASYIGPMASGFGLPAGGAAGGYQPPAGGGYAPPTPPAPPAYTPPAPPAAPAYTPPAAPAYTPPAPPAPPAAPVVEAPAAPPAPTYEPPAPPAPPAE